VTAFSVLNATEGVGNPSSLFVVVLCKKIQLYLTQAIYWLRKIAINTKNNIPKARQQWNECVSGRTQSSSIDLKESCVCPNVSDLLFDWYGIKWVYVMMDKKLSRARRNGHYQRKDCIRGKPSAWYLCKMIVLLKKLMSSSMAEVPVFKGNWMKLKRILIMKARTLASMFSALQLVNSRDECTNIYVNLVSVPRDLGEKQVQFVQCYW